MSPVLSQRQEFVGDDGAVFITNDTGYFVTWLILGAITVILFFWFVIGYYHARSRVRRGLAPMMYHRFLVPANMRNPRKVFPQDQFSLQPIDAAGYNAPPPTYNPNAPLPPSYQTESKDGSLPYDVPPPGNPPAPAQQELPPRQEAKKTGWFKKVVPFRK